MTQAIVLRQQASVRVYVIAKIEESILQILEALKDNRLFLAEYRAESRFTTKRLRRCLVSAAQFKSFARYLRVLESIYMSLVQNLVITKRSIYYQDVELFGSQQVVDQIIEDIAYQYQVPRHNLNIVAASKGLIAGPISIYLKNGSVVRCGYISATGNSEVVNEENNAGYLIPSEGYIESIECTAGYVLVVEKETVFRWLLSSGFRRLFWNCILITGKGYPDVATRYILNLISTTNNYSLSKDRNDFKMPIWSLIDGDPHGIDIHVIYKWGGRMQYHNRDLLACPDIQCLGLHSQDIKQYPISERSKIYLRNADRKKALNMIAYLQSLDSQDRDAPSRLDHNFYHAQFLIRELSCILHQNVKYELEALSSVDNQGLLTFLRNKMLQL